MAKKQTAVEWLYEQVKFVDKESYNNLVFEFEKAKEMENEQMLEMWNGGINCTEEGGTSFDQHYNETYQKSKQ